MHYSKLAIGEVEKREEVSVSPAETEQDQSISPLTSYGS